MKITELRTKSAEELQALIVEKRTELAEKQRSLKAGELANTQNINVIRRDIAKAMTLIQEQRAQQSSAGEEA